LAPKAETNDKQVVAATGIVTEVSVALK
jgi:hypothetical protein